MLRTLNGNEIQDLKARGREGQSSRSQVARQPENQETKSHQETPTQIEKSDFVAQLFASASELVGSTATSVTALTHAAKLFSGPTTPIDSLDAFEKVLNKLEHRLQQGDLFENEGLLSELEQRAQVLQGVGKSETNPRLQFLLGKMALLKAQLASLRGDAKEVSSLHQKAVEHFNRADENSVTVSPLKGKTCHFRAISNEALGNYEAVLADQAALALLGPASRRQGGESQAQGHQAKLDFLKAQAGFAHESGDLLQEAILLSQALNLKEALGEEVSVEEQDYLARLTREVLSEQTLTRLEEQTAAGEITPELLDHFEQLAQKEGTAFYQARINLKEWLELEARSDGKGYSIDYSELFLEAPEDRRIEILSALQELSAVAELRSKAQAETHPLKKSYLESQVALLDGESSLAKLKLIKVYEQLPQITDPELRALGEAAGEQLRQFNLAHIEQMKAYTDTLYLDRHGSEYKGSDRRPEDHLRELSQESLSLLQGIFERKEACTLEEALQIIETMAAQDRAEAIAQGESEAELREWDWLAATNSEVSLARRADSFLYNSAHPEIAKQHAKGDQMTVEGGDKYFLRLLELETSESWEKTKTEAGLREEYTDIGEVMRGWGSRRIAASFLERVMSEDIALYAKQCREGALHEANNIFTEKELMEEIQEQLKILQKEDLSLYQQRFPSGKPSQADLDRMLQEAKAARIEFRTKQATFRILHEKGFSDSSQEAWGIYRDMLDPLNETKEISDEGWTAILKEAIIMAITMPATMGVGAGARGALLASKWGQRALSYSRMTSALWRGGTFIVGSALEGAVMTLPHAIQTGKFDAASVGHNIVMSMIFHGVGKVWKGYSAEVGIQGAKNKAMLEAAEAGQQALEGVSGAAARQVQLMRRVRALAMVDTVGMINLQSLVATMAMDPENRGDVIDDYLGHVARNLGFHYGAVAMRGIAPGLMNREAEILAKYEPGDPFAALLYDKPPSPPRDSAPPPPQPPAPPTTGAGSSRGPRTTSGLASSSSHAQAQLSFADRVANSIWEGGARLFKTAGERIFGNIDGSGGMNPGVEVMGDGLLIFHGGEPSNGSGAKGDAWGSKMSWWNPFKWGSSSKPPRSPNPAELELQARQREAARRQASLDLGQYWDTCGIETSTQGSTRYLDGMPFESGSFKQFRSPGRYEGVLSEPHTLKDFSTLPIGTEIAFVVRRAASSTKTEIYIEHIKLPHALATPVTFRGKQLFSEDVVEKPHSKNPEIISQHHDHSYVHELPDYSSEAGRVDNTANAAGLYRTPAPIDHNVEFDAWVGKMDRISTGSRGSLDQAPRMIDEGLALFPHLSPENQRLFLQTLGWLLGAAETHHDHALVIRVAEALRQIPLTSDLLQADDHLTLRLLDRFKHQLPHERREEVYATFLALLIRTKQHSEGLHDFCTSEVFCNLFHPTATHGREPSERIVRYLAGAVVALYRDSFPRGTSADLTQFLQYCKDAAEGTYRVGDKDPYAYRVYNEVERLLRERTPEDPGSGADIRTHGGHGNTGATGAQSPNQSQLNFADRVANSIWRVVLGYLRQWEIGFWETVMIRVE